MGAAGVVVDEGIAAAPFAKVTHSSAATATLMDERRT
jgi:hypothetical protein